MKKLFYVIWICLLLVFANKSLAQDEATAVKITTPEWISDKGYWVIESKAHAPKSSMIYFYNNENELVYKEDVEGVKIRINKTKVLLKLKSILDQSVTAWEHKNRWQENQSLVTIALR